MKVLIIRHAEPDYPNHTITAAGHLEARALAEHLRQIGIDRIYSSPVNRAVHTMKYTSELLELEPGMEPWTRELSWQAQIESRDKPIAIWNIPGETVRAVRPDTGYHEWASQAPYNEYADRYDIIKRDSDDFLKRHGYVREDGRYRIEAPNREVIAVFCHLGFGLTWLSHLLELPLPLVWSSFWLPSSSVTTILFEEHSRQWATPRCTGLGAVAHLHKAGLPVSAMGLMANVD
jgi:probable phosphoglycerate mutase